MKLLKRTEYNDLVKSVNAIQMTGIINLLKKMTIIKKLVKLKRNLLTMIIVISILLHKNLI